MEGLPIDWKFQKQQLGSFTPRFYDHERYLLENDLIGREDISMPRMIQSSYTLTEKGEKLFEEKILPFLKSNKFFDEKCIVALAEKYSKKTATQAKNDEHKLLMLDDCDRAELKKRCKETFNNLTKLYSIYSEQPPDDYKTYELAGMIQYTYCILNVIITDYLNDEQDNKLILNNLEYMGYYYEIYLAQKFLEHADKITLKFKKNGKISDECFDKIKMKYETIRDIAIHYLIVPSLDSEKFDFKIFFPEGDQKLLQNILA